MNVYVRTYTNTYIYKHIQNYVSKVYVYVCMRMYMCMYTKYTYSDIEMYTAILTHTHATLQAAGAPTPCLYCVVGPGSPNMGFVNPWGSDGL